MVPRAMNDKFDSWQLKELNQDAPQLPFVKFIVSCTRKYAITGTNLKNLFGKFWTNLLKFVYILQKKIIIDVCQASKYSSGYFLTLLYLFSLKYLILHDAQDKQRVEVYLSEIQRTLFHIYDGTFLRKKLTVLGSYIFGEKLHHRCMRVPSTRL